MSTTHVNDSGNLASTCPVPEDKLRAVVSQACKATIGETYSHESSSEWTQKIISTIIDGLKEQTKGFKFLVFVTLVNQEANSPVGIRAACGYYGNFEKDGIWHYKYADSEATKTEAIVSIAWISI